MNKLVILVSGKLGSGKNTLADILKEEIEAEYGTSVAIDYFARLLKEMCRDSFRPLTDYLNQMFSTVYEMEGDFGGYEFSKMKIEDESWFEKKTPISRMILQIIGTDIVRTVNENFWSESFIKRTNERKELVVLNSDCRFPSEIEQVQKNFDTITIRVEREMDRDGVINEHISEKALDCKTDWDYVIHNNDSLGVLRVQAKSIVRSIEKYFKCAK